MCRLAADLNFPVPKKPLPTVGNGLDRSAPVIANQWPRPASLALRAIHLLRTLVWQSASLVWRVESGVMVPLRGGLNFPVPQTAEAAPLLRGAVARACERD